MKKRIINKVMMMFLLCLVFTFFIQLSRTNVLAATNLQVLTTSSGTELKYRSSSEKVMALKEYDYPTAEFRGVWVSTFVGDIPAFTTKEKFISDANKILDNMELMGMNAMIFHVRTHNNALYNSDLNPIASWWVNVNFDAFDPLEWLITECHNRGIEFHAWMNPYRVDMSGFVGEEYPDGHPCNNPNLILSNGSAKILDPGSTVVQDFIVDTCMEFLDRYDADAIHFDDYFYISGVAENLSADAKRHNVDAFIEKLSNAMRKMNKEEARAVQLGISPSGIYQNGGYAAAPSYNSDGSLKSPIASNTSGFAHYGSYLYSDTKKWIDNEWIDYILPQSYWGLEHTGANFFELTRWWSWCVKYKKVNLFMGMGIYMALENTGSAKFWQRNENEVRNQLLNAGMYDEIQGISMYKYSTLLSLSNKIIKNGVDVISNDFWKKRVPGVPYQQYVDAIPSVKVSNLTYNNNTLQWDKIDNVFGYMVYQVPIGEELDQSNNDHLLAYTQNNFIDNIDTLNYNYYISSVNRANVISSPVQYGGLEIDDYELVINSIEKLPSTITFDLAESIKKIRAKYNSLNEADKKKVFNIEKLNEAEKIISKLTSMKNEVDSFLKTVDKKINTDRILPVNPGMKWTYKNLEDAEKYNISNGKRLKNYLTSYIITLILEYTKDDLVFYQEVDFDLSLLKAGQVGLVYRNDASCMSQDHVGAHTGQSTYIGWSKVTLTVDKYVLFLARDNYHEITDDTIAKCVWTSCAGVYKNMLSTNKQITLNQAFSTASPSYGYFVISAQNTVKLVSETSLETATITLLPGETLVIIRYLDRIINENPFAQISNITIGMSSFLTKYETIEITDKEKGEAVDALIEALPDDVTLNDEEKVNEVLNKYESLNDESKKYVSKYNELMEKIQKIDSLKKELANLKTNAINEINSYVKLENYSSNNQEAIKKIITSVTTLIKNAKSKAEIDNYLKSGKTKIDNIKTLKQECKEYLDEEIQKVFNEIDFEEYSITNQELIKKYIEDTKEELNSLLENLTNIIVDQKILELKGKINQLPTKKEELDAKCGQAKDELLEYASKNKYSATMQKEVDKIVYDGYLEIDECDDITLIDEIITKYKKLIDDIPTYEEELTKYKNEQNDNIENNLKDSEAYIYALKNDEQLQKELETLLVEYKEKINTCKTINQVNKLVEEFKNTLEFNNIKVYARIEFALVKEEINFEDYSTENKNLIYELIDNYLNKVVENLTKDDVDKLVLECKEEIKQIPSLADELNSRKNEVINYLSSLKKDGLSENKAKKIEELVSKYTDIVENAKEISELDNIEEQINGEYNQIINSKDQVKKGCKSKSNFVCQLLLIISASLCCLIIRKKK